MQFDSAGLGYTTDGRRIFVHYPKKDETGVVRYGAGMDISPIPEWYWIKAPNAATAERVAIWRELIAESRVGGNRSPKPAAVGSNPTRDVSEPR